MKELRAHPTFFEQMKLKIAAMMLMWWWILRSSNDAMAAERG